MFISKHSPAQQKPKLKNQKFTTTKKNWIEKGVTLDAVRRTKLAYINNDRFK